MTFKESISSVLGKYATFSGRATRSEYWWFALFSIIVTMIAGGISQALLNSDALGGLVSLALLLPSLAVSARRLHDIDKAGWWMLIGIVPILGWILLIIWYCTKGSVGENRFGFPPAS